MCGIIGYIGYRDASKILVDCLKRLEYRGYDSAGIATIAKSGIQIEKDVGEIDKINLKLNFEKMEGNTGIGHCLHPETYVCTTDGRLTKISGLNNQKVLSINFNRATVKNGRNQILMKHKSPDYLFNIKTSFSEFKATGEHRVFVTDGEGVKEKKVGELTGSELIAVPRRIPHFLCSIKHFQDVPVKRHYMLNYKLRKNLKEARLNNNYTRKDVERKTGIKETYLTRIERGERSSIEDQKLKALENIYNNLKIRNEAEFTHRTPVFFPNVSTKELSQIIGYFIGDGFFHSNRCIRFKDARKEILKKYNELFKKIFNLNGNIHESIGHYYLDINSKYLVDWFKENLPELFKKTGKEEIPDFVFEASKDHISSFLKGIYDAEGFVALRSNQLCIAMTNEDLIKKIQFLLLKFGILATFCKEHKKDGWSDSYRLNINGKKSFEIFKKHVGFTAKDKEIKLNKLLNRSMNRNVRYSSFPYKKKYFYHNYLKQVDIQFPDSSDSYYTDLVLEKILNKLGNNHYKIKSLIKKYLYSDIIWARFSIDKIKSDVEYVWDLEVERDHNFIGNLFIQHNSRWATHGGVTKENAHPHLSTNKKIAIVHNGIIENFRKLKEQLIAKGYKFTSQTDSEVLAHLIEDNYQGDLEKAVYNALKKVEGYYAIVVTSSDEPDKIIGARKDSPLVIGVGDSENFLASDVPAFLKYTNRVIYLNDGEICCVTEKDVKVYDSKNNPVEKHVDIIKWDFKDAEKSGFPHFMLKEIFDQKDTVTYVTRGRISEIDRKIEFHEKVENLLKSDVDLINIVACGTSYYAGLVGKYFIEKLTKIPVVVELASEYRYFGIKKENSLVIAITQSGETLDTLAALKEAKASGCKILVITNVIGSSATRISDSYILTQSGPEIGVAATKTFTAQVITLFLIALKIGFNQNKIGLDEVSKNILELKELQKIVRDVLEKSADILEIAKQLKNAKSVFFIGRGINYPLALEGALKLKEISYIHAEGFAAGELKHGPFALLTETTPVVAIATKGQTYDKILANIGEVKARGSKVLAIADENDIEIEKHADLVLRYPSNSELLSCIPIIVILQLLAYHVANLNGCSIDKPRNLAKSVTVE